MAIIPSVGSKSRIGSYVWTVEAVEPATHGNEADTKITAKSDTGRIWTTTWHDWRYVAEPLEPPDRATFF
jgi:hypothetical protein